MSSPLSSSELYPDPENFLPIPKPAHEDDWLAQYTPDNQTYRQWEVRYKNRIEKVNKKIYLMPLGPLPYTMPNNRVLGDFPDGSPNLDSIEKYCSAFYYPLEVECLDPVKINVVGSGEAAKATIDQKCWNEECY